MDACGRLLKGRECRAFLSVWRRPGLALPEKRPRRPVIGDEGAASDDVDVGFAA